VIKPIKYILIRIQRVARRKSLQRATREANKICLATGKTMLIYFFEGEYRWMAKQDMKRSGMSGAQAEAFANAILVKYMKPKEEKPAPPKMTPEVVKKLREETIKKLDTKIVRK
jgi:hypothetical protein